MQKEISRVHRSNLEARASYDRLSRWYDWVSAPFERAARERGLALLDARPGEQVLEVGFGTGWALLSLADAVGPLGLVCGIDQSSAMAEISRRRLKTSNRQAGLVLGDALALPLASARFDALFMCFTLELFDTPLISEVLKQCRRALHPEGRICVVSMSKSARPAMTERMYEWFHASFPSTFDCRPIYAKESLSQSGFAVSIRQAGSLWGLPVSIVLANPV